MEERKTYEVVKSSYNEIFQKNLHIDMVMDYHTDLVESSRQVAILASK